MNADDEKHIAILYYGCILAIYNENIKYNVWLVNPTGYYYYVFLYSLYIDGEQQVQAK